jgi:HK97 gp10 family phage protein
MSGYSFNRKMFLDRLHQAEGDALEAVAMEIVERAKAKAPVRKIYSEGGTRKRTKAASPALIAAAIRQVQNNKRLSARQRTEALYLLQRHPEEARVAIRRHNSNNRRQSTLLGTYKTISLKKNGMVVTSANVFRGRGITKGTVPIHRIERNTKPKLGFEPGPEFDQLLDARGRYEVRSGRALTSATGEAISPGENKSQVRIGGRLKNSIIQSSITREGTRVSIQVGTDVPYAMYVEFPTRHNAAQPFLLPALKETQRALGPTLENELRAQGLKG